MDHPVYLYVIFGYNITKCFETSSYPDHLSTCLRQLSSHEISILVRALTREKNVGTLS